MTRPAAENQDSRDKMERLLAAVISLREKAQKADIRDEEAVQKQDQLVKTMSAQLKLMAEIRGSLDEVKRQMKGPGPTILEERVPTNIPVSVGTIRRNDGTPHYLPPSNNHQVFDKLIQRALSDLPSNSHGAANEPQNYSRYDTYQKRNQSSSDKVFDKSPQREQSTQRDYGRWDGDIQLNQEGISQILQPWPPPSSPTNATGSPGSTVLPWSAHRGGHYSKENDVIAYPVYHFNQHDKQWTENISIPNTFSLSFPSAIGGSSTSGMRDDAPMVAFNEASLDVTPHLGNVPADEFYQLHLEEIPNNPSSCSMTYLAPIDSAEKEIDQPNKGITVHMAEVELSNPFKYSEDCLAPQCSGIVEKGNDQPKSRTEVTWAEEDSLLFKIDDNRSLRSEKMELMTSLERADASTVWKEIPTAGGRKYYYNKETKQYKWVIPEELKLARELAEKEAAQGVQFATVMTSSVQVRETVDFIEQPSAVTLVGSTPSTISGVASSPISITPVVNTPPTVVIGLSIVSVLNPAMTSSVGASSPAKVLGSSGVVALYNSYQTPNSGIENSSPQVASSLSGASIQDIEKARKGMTTAGKISLVHKEEKTTGEEPFTYAAKQEAKSAFKVLLESAVFDKELQPKDKDHQVVNPSQHHMSSHCGPPSSTVVPSKGSSTSVVQLKKQGSTGAFQCSELDLALSEIHKIEEWKYQCKDIIQPSAGNAHLLLRALLQTKNSVERSISISESFLELAMASHVQSFEVKRIERNDSRDAAFDKDFSWKMVVNEVDSMFKPLVARFGQICSIKRLEDIITKARTNKTTLLLAMESAISLLKEVKLQGKATQQVLEGVVEVSSCLRFYRCLLQNTPMTCELALLHVDPPCEVGWFLRVYREFTNEKQLAEVKFIKRILVWKNLSRLEDLVYELRKKSGEGVNFVFDPGGRTNLVQILISSPNNLEDKILYRMKYHPKALF